MQKMSSYRCTVISFSTCAFQRFATPKLECYCNHLTITKTGFMPGNIHIYHLFQSENTGRDQAQCRCSSSCHSS